MGASSECTHPSVLFQQVCNTRKTGAHILGAGVLEPECSMSGTCAADTIGRDSDASVSLVQAPGR